MTCGRAEENFVNLVINKVQIKSKQKLTSFFHFQFVAHIQNSPVWGHYKGTLLTLHVWNKKNRMIFLTQVTIVLSVQSVNMRVQQWNLDGTKTSHEL